MFNEFYNTHLVDSNEEQDACEKDTTEDCEKEKMTNSQLYSLKTRRMEDTAIQKAAWTFVFVGLEDILFC